jgi:BlaI family penicillinase repressor
MRSIVRVTETELQILDVLWDKPAQTIRSLSETIYQDASPSHYATVQSLLERLERKGWVSRDRSGHKHQFSAVRDRSEFIGQQIQDVADAVCDGSVAALLGQLAQSGRLTSKDRKQLRRLVEGGDS